MLTTLRWASDIFPPLNLEEVVIKMSAMGLNFLDLAMIIVDISRSLGKGYNALGSEGAGVVTKVGANMSDFKVGDRVATIVVDTSVFATTIQGPARLCARLASNLSDENAVGILIPYVTDL